MITQTSEKTKCDVKDCKNMAGFYIPAKGRVGKFFLCKECCEKLCNFAIERRTPKSPKSAIKRIIEQKEQELLTFTE